MLASTWISEHFSADLSEEEILSILPELASMLKIEMKVPELSLTIGVVDRACSEEFDEIVVLMLTGEAA